MEALEKYGGEVAPDTDFAMLSSSTFVESTDIFGGVFSIDTTTDDMIESVDSEKPVMQVCSTMTTRSMNPEDSRTTTTTLVKLRANESIDADSRRRKKQQAVLRTTVYTCAFCPKTWSSQFALNRHENSHTGTTQFECNECNKLFKQESNLKVHVDSVHAKLKHTCPICCDSLSSAANLIHHLNKTHATELGVHCDLCNTWMRGDLVRHQTTTSCINNTHIAHEKRKAAIDSLFEFTEDDAVNALSAL
jgi:uncharacterized C2H2 Zn-finger protein